VQYFVGNHGPALHVTTMPRARPETMPHPADPCAVDKTAGQLFFTKACDQANQNRRAKKEAAPCWTIHNPEEDTPSHHQQRSGQKITRHQHLGCGSGSVYP